MFFSPLPSPPSRQCQWPITTNARSVVIICRWGWLVVAHVVIVVGIVLVVGVVVIIFVVVVTKTAMAGIAPPHTMAIVQEYIQHGHTKMNYLAP